MQAQNIIIVNDFAFINGGAAKVSIVSAVELANKGFNVIFFCAVGPVCEELRNSKVKVICLNQTDILNNKNRLSAFVQGIWNSKAEKEMKRLLLKYDNTNTIVHIHGFIKALTSSVIKVALEKQFKLVITLHDYFTVCPNGGLYNYKTEEICKLTPMSKECILCNCDSRHYYYKIWRVLRQRKQISKGFIPSGVKNYIYISEMSKNVLKSYLPSDSRYHYVKNPIDVKKEKMVDIVKNKPFVYIGRLSKEKGVLLFAEAAKKLGCEAIFVGDGEMKSQIQSIYPGAIITGWLQKVGVNNYLRKARALVFPSLWYEGLPLTILEAKAKGIPVIVSDGCSGREVIDDGIDGLWFKRNNKTDLINKIYTLIKKDDALITMGNHGYNDYWDDSYDLQTHLDMLLKCYDNLK